MATKNILIRADASTDIGTGHIMRCLSLARLLREHDYSVIFVCQELAGNLCDFIEEKNFQVWRLLNNPQNSDQIWQSEVAQIISIIDRRKSKIDWLIVDHYSIDVKWESELRPFVKRIMVIDDLADRFHDCDLLLDQTPYKNLTTRYKSLVSSSCLQLLGSDYLMLRSEFTNKSKRFTKKVAIAKKILITMGGSDARNITCWLLEALEKIQTPLSIKIAIGASCPFFDKIKMLAATVTLHEVYVEQSVNNISDWMNWSDLAICAGGFTTYELAFMGTPTLVISASWTQLEAITTLHELGIIKFIGEFEAISIENMVDILNGILFNIEERIELSYHGSKKIDGYGVIRVVEQLMKDIT